MKKLFLIICGLLLSSGCIATSKQYLELRQETTALWEEKARKVEIEELREDLMRLKTEIRDMKEKAKFDAEFCGEFLTYFGKHYGRHLRDLHGITPETE